MNLEFQQTEGERQQNQWAENKNFTTSVNQHIVLVQDTLNNLKTAAAVREEKITKAVNNGDKAAGQLKNIMKKIATYATLPGKIETVTREQVCNQLETTVTNSDSMLQSKNIQKRNAVTLCYDELLVVIGSYYYASTQNIMLISKYSCCNVFSH